MTWRGRVERYLRSIVEEGEVVHMTLVDPEKFSDDIYKAVAQMIEAGTDAILVGGSLMVMELRKASNSLSRKCCRNI